VQIPKSRNAICASDRLSEGKIPACAEAYPGALKFGSRRELLEEARKRIIEKPDEYVNMIYGETVAGGTGFMYISPAPFNELGFDTNLQNSSYPALSKGFLYTVPAVFVLLPTLLLGIQQATKSNQNKVEDHE
jgi:hypothetical protein